MPGILCLYFDFQARYVLQFVALVASVRMRINRHDQSIVLVKRGPFRGPRTRVLVESRQCGHYCYRRGTPRITAVRSSLVSRQARRARLGDGMVEERPGYMPDILLDAITRKGRPEKAFLRFR